MIRRPYMKECNAAQLTSEIETAGLTLSEEGGGGRFFGAESFGVHVVVYYADDITQPEEDLGAAAVWAHVPAGS